MSAYDQLYLQAANSQSPLFGEPAPEDPNALSHKLWGLVSGQHMPTAAGPPPPLAPALTPAANMPPASVEPIRVEPSFEDKLKEIAAASNEDANNKSAAALGLLRQSQQQMQVAANHEMLANQQAGDIKQGFSREQALLYEQQARREGENQKVDEQAAAARKQEVDEAVRRSRMASDIATNAEVKSFWHDKATGSRVLGVLAQTLAGAANGLAGTPGAPSALDRIIDQDFERQKSNIANKRDAAYRAEGALGQLYNNYKNEDEAKAAMRLAAWKMVDIKSKQLQAHMEGELQPSTVSATNAQLQQKIEQSEMGVAQVAAQAAQAKAQSALDSGVKLAQVDALRINAENKAGEKYIQVPGLKGRYRRDLFTEEYSKRSQAYGRAFGSLGALEKTLADPVSYANWKKGDALSALMRGDVRVLLGTGAALSAAELQDANNIALSYFKNRSISSVSKEEMHTLVNNIRTAIGHSFVGTARGQFHDVEFDPDDSGFGGGIRAAMGDMAQ